MPVKSLYKALLVALLALLSAQSAEAQFKGFIQIGMTGASFRGGNLQDASPIFRLSGGGGIRYLYPSGFEFETGLEYAVKGSKLSGTIDEIPIEGVSEITYVSMPILIGYRFNRSGKLQPRLVAGASMSFKTDAQITFNALGSDFEQQEVDQSVEARDLGIVVGLDANRLVGGEILTLGVRSTFGYSNARTAKPELLNTSIGLYAGIVF